MWVETPNSTPEVQQTQPEAPKMPNEHPEKKWLFAEISDMLRKLSDSLGLSKFFGNENPDKKTNGLQEFMANMLASFQGIDIEKGVTLRTEGDVQKIREALRPIIDLDETSIEFKSGDLIKYNKETGTVDFYPADKNNPSGHSTIHDARIWTEEQKEQDIQPIIIPTTGNTKENTKGAENSTQKSQETKESNNISNNIAKALGDHVTKHGAINLGPSSCWPAVDALLKRFGLNNVTPGKGRNGNAFEKFLNNDPRFEKLNITSFDQIPAGAVLVYSGQWRSNSAAHKAAGHVEIKGSDRKFYSYYESSRAGGSTAKFSWNSRNNFEEWKRLSGFAGAWIPTRMEK